MVIDGETVKESANAFKCTYFHIDQVHILSSNDREMSIQRALRQDKNDRPLSVPSLHFSYPQQRILCLRPFWFFFKPLCSTEKPFLSDHVFWLLWRRIGARQDGLRKPWHAQRDDCRKMLEGARWHRNSIGVSKVNGKGNKAGFKYCWGLTVLFMHYIGITLVCLDILLSIQGLSHPGQCFQVHLMVVIEVKLEFWSWAVIPSWISDLHHPRPSKPYAF